MWRASISNFCSNLTFFYGFSSSLHKRHLRQSLKSNLSNGRRLVRQTLTLADVVKEKENFTWPYKLSADMEGDILLGNYSITGYYFWKLLVASPGCIKVSFSYLSLLLTFLFGVSSNLLQQKSPTAEIIVIYFLGTIPTASGKYLPIISAVGLFCCDKFEELTQNEKVI